jgi:hypothetical protein
MQPVASPRTKVSPQGVTGYGGEGGSRRGIRRDRIASARRLRGSEIDNRGGDGGSYGGWIGWRRTVSATATSASAASTTATAAAFTVVSATAATAATGEQQNRHQGNDREPTASAGEAKRPCHCRTSLSGRYLVGLWLRGSRFAVIFGNASLPTLALLPHLMRPDTVTDWQRRTRGIIDPSMPPRATFARHRLVTGSNRVVRDWACKKNAWAWRKRREQKKRKALFA